MADMMDKNLFGEDQLYYDTESKTRRSKNKSDLKYIISLIKDDFTDGMEFGLQFEYSEKEFIRTNIKSMWRLFKGCKNREEFEETYYYGMDEEFFDKRRSKQ